MTETVASGLTMSGTQHPRRFHCPHDHETCEVALRFPKLRADDLDAVRSALPCSVCDRRIATLGGACFDTPSGTTHLARGIGRTVRPYRCRRGHASREGFASTRHPAIEGNRSDRPQSASRPDRRRDRRSPLGAALVGMLPTLNDGRAVSSTIVQWLRKRFRVPRATVGKRFIAALHGRAAWLMAGHAMVGRLLARGQTYQQATGDCSQRRARSVSA